MSGRLAVIGLGPGAARFRTAEAEAELAAADFLYGYGPYLDRIDVRPGQKKIASDNRVELDRANAALTDAASGGRIAMVSGGDPGVFAMASAVCEAIEHGPAEWRGIDIAIIPGVTAMLAVAAACGAPLGHDFCAISLSDNLKPWSLVEQRLAAAAGAGFAIALYNPISRARPWQLGAAFELLRGVLPARIPVIFGRAIGRDEATVTIETLAGADPRQADMATLVIIGTAETRLIERPGRAPLVYAPRSAGGA